MTTETMIETETHRNSPATVEEGYEMVHNLIFDQVHKFRRRFGGDFDELVGEANLAFVRGHHQYMLGVAPSGRVPDHSYATEIRRWVWYEMFDAMRLRLDRNRRVPMMAMDAMELDPADKGCPFRWAEFVDELSEDGRVVAQLALDPPPEVERVAEAKGGQPRNMRSTVRSYLTDMGWKAERIAAAFEELRVVLG